MPAILLLLSFLQILHAIEQSLPLRRNLLHFINNASDHMVGALRSGSPH